MSISIKNLVRSYNERPIVVYPVYLRITEDYATAIALAQILYWHGAVSRKFYKTDAELAKEINATPKQMKRIKECLKALNFLKITIEGIPAKTFYDVDYELLAKAIAEHSLEPDPLGDGNGGDTGVYQKGQSDTEPPFQANLSQKGLTGENKKIPAGLSQKGPTQQPEKVPANTESTNRDYTTTTTTASSSVVSGSDLIFSKVFSKAEREKMAKILEAVAEIDVKQQMLDVLTAAVQDGKVKNKLSYLRGLAKSHANGLFDPLPGFYVAQRRADALAGSQAAGFTDQRQVAQLESELNGLIRINNQGLLDGQIASKRQKLAELKASRPV